MIDFILSHAWDWFIGSLCFSLVCAVFAIAFAGIAHPEGDSLIIRDYYGSELAIPEWVKFIAMGKDGRVRAYEAQPETVEGGGYDGTWSTRGRGYAFIIGWRSENVAEKEWRNSLREVQK